MQEDAAPLLSPPVFAGKDSLLKFPDVIAISDNFYDSAIIHHGQSNSNILLRKQLGLIGLPCFVVEEYHVIGWFLYFFLCRHKQVTSSIGNMGKMLRSN